MADTKLSGLFVEVFTKGFEKVQAGITSFKAGVQSAVASVGKLNDSITQAGNVATKGFLAGSAAISGFVKVADPRGTMLLQGTLGAISVQLGSIFLPILDKVTAALERVLSWLRTLSDEQKDQISHWAEVAGVIALSVAVLPKLIGLVQTGAIAFKVLGAAIGLATGGIVPLLGLLAAGAVGFGVFESSAESGASILDTLRTAVEPLIESFKDFGSKLLTALAPIGEALKSLLPIVSSCLKIIADLFISLLDKVSAVLEPLGSLVATVIGVMAKSFEMLAPMLQTASDLILQAVDIIIPIFNQIVETVEQMVDAAEPIITAFSVAVAWAFKMIGAVIGGTLEGLQPLWDGLIEIIQTVGDVFSAVFDMISDLLGGFNDSLSESDGICKTIFDGMKQAVLLLQPVFEGVFNAIKAAVLSLGKVLVYIGSLMKSIATGNFRGAFDRAAEATKELEEKFKERGEKRKKKKDDKDEEAAWNEFDKQFPEDKEKKKPDKGRHGGAGVAKVELSSIADYHKKAQTSQFDSPEAKIAQERLETQKEANRKLDEQTKELRDINKKTKDSPATFA